MLTIRLQRTGKKNQADFRIVLAEKEAPVKKKFQEVLGSYNPRRKTFQVKEERIKYWLGNRVEMSPTVHNLFVTKGLLEASKVKAFSVPKKAEAPQGAAPAAEAPASEPVPAETPAQQPASSVRRSALFTATAHRDRHSALGCDRRRRRLAVRSISIQSAEWHQPVHGYAVDHKPVPRRHHDYDRRHGTFDCRYCDQYGSWGLSGWCWV
jgi:small subunit ribosomal protein S16